LRSEETSFQVDHMKATCRVGVQKSDAEDKAKIFKNIDNDTTQVNIDPESDLYGEILFHRGRFKRLRSYRRLNATECIAEITPDGKTDWFSSYLPSELVLGDPGGRDAAIHAIQACIPHATLLPIGVDRLVIGKASSFHPRVVSARERSHEDDIFIYDVEVLGTDGCVLERWHGLQLRTVGGEIPRSIWVESLLGPYMDRRIQELIPGSNVTIAVNLNQNRERSLRSERTIQQALRKAVAVRRRPDGKPEVDGDLEVSLSHAGKLTFAVAGPAPIGCDVEVVSSRSFSVWQDLLGSERFRLAEVIAEEGDEDLNIAATRVWTVTECLKKAGAIGNSPIVLESLMADSWVLVASGPQITATCVTHTRNSKPQLVFAVLVRSHNASI